MNNTQVREHDADGEPMQCIHCGSYEFDRIDEEGEILSPDDDWQTVEYQCRNCKKDIYE